MGLSKQQLSTSKPQPISLLYGIDATTHCGLADSGRNALYKRIWSLYDMLRFYADFFTRACLELEKIRELTRRDGWRTDVDLTVSTVKKECERIGFRHLAYQAQRIIEKIHRPRIGAAVLAGEDNDKNEIVILSRELRLGIEQKLKSCMFLRVHTDRIDFYSDEDLPRFGKDVAKAIPRATYHIAEAGRCYALERWDGCVHHLMLATEEALRQWAKNFKMKPTKPLILSNWETIFQNAHHHLKDLRGKKKTIRLDRKIKRIAETLAHFESIRDAWRNHSEHGREKYDERRAANLTNHVGLFMQSLVKKRTVLPEI